MNKILSSLSAIPLFLYFSGCAAFHKYSFTNIKSDELYVNTSHQHYQLQDITRQDAITKCILLSQNKDLRLEEKFIHVENAQTLYEIGYAEKETENNSQVMSNNSIFNKFKKGDCLTAIHIHPVSLLDKFAKDKTKSYITQLIEQLKKIEKTESLEEDISKLESILSSDELLEKYSIIKDLSAPSDDDIRTAINEYKLCRKKGMIYTSVIASPEAYTQFSFYENSLSVDIKPLSERNVLTIYLEINSSLRANGKYRLR